VIPYIPFQRVTRCQDGASRCQPVGVGAGRYRLVRVGARRYRSVRVGARRYRLVRVGAIGNVGYNPCSSVQDRNTMATCLIENTASASARSVNVDILAKPRQDIKGGWRSW
jgi:hypothetical protein